MTGSRPLSLSSRVIVRVPLAPCARKSSHDRKNLETLAVSLPPTNLFLYFALISYFPSFSSFLNFLPFLPFFLFYFPTFFLSLLIFSFFLTFLPFLFFLLFSFFFTFSSFLSFFLTFPPSLPFLLSSHYSFFFTFPPSLPFLPLLLLSFSLLWNVHTGEKETRTRVKETTLENRGVQARSARGFSLRVTFRYTELRAERDRTASRDARRLRRINATEKCSGQQEGRGTRFVRGPFLLSKTTRRLPVSPPPPCTVHRETFPHPPTTRLWDSFARRVRG